MMMFTLMLMMAMITLLLISLSYMLTEKDGNKEKNEMYECGFTPINKLGNPFSMSFFVMAMLFLVFDLEMVLLFPWSISTFFFFSFESFILVFFFLLILTMGLIYEWYSGGLEWD